MGYFNELPDLLYPSLLPKSSRSDEKIRVKNLEEQNSELTAVHLRLQNYMKFQKVSVQICLQKNCIKTQNWTG